MSLPPTPTILAPTAVAAACRVQFGAARAEIDRPSPAALRVALPVLHGAADECLLADAAPLPEREGFALFRRDGQLAGFAVAAEGRELEAATADLYRRLFAAARGAHLYRIWNYVPHINEIRAGLENYRRFCRGRSLAFESHFGRAFQQQLPAASGVGVGHGPLAVAFLAGEASPQHCENPQQVPAFHYPAAYGPRPPSFSRATLVRPAGAAAQLFISGTAAIRGHATVGVGDVEQQLECTIENLGAIGTAAGLAADLGGAAGAQRSFKIYLRRAADLGRVRSHLQRTLLRADDAVSYLQADLCRSDLLVEIEAVITT